MIGIGLHIGGDNSGVVPTLSTPTPFNVALASNGSTATALSSTDATFLPVRANNGYRNTDNKYGIAGATGGCWVANAPGSVGTPQWLQIDFGQSRTITEFDVITLADAVNYTSNPTLATTFTLYGIADFKTQYWDGGAWVDVNTVTANNKVWRQFTFSAIVTTKIRCSVSAGTGGAPRIVEFEAWGY